MFLTVPWEILKLGKNASCMFCIIKSYFIVSCNSLSINREKLGDYLKWTDYSVRGLQASNCVHVCILTCL